MSPVVGRDIRVYGLFNAKTGLIHHYNNTATFELGDFTGEDAEDFANNARDIVAEKSPHSSLAVEVTILDLDKAQFNYAPAAPALAA